MLHRHDRGVVRREILQVGFSGFPGLALPKILAGRAQAASGASGAGRAPA